VIAAVETAILARLRAASDTGALGYRWGSLETYPADWDAYQKDKGGQITAPGAWVVFAGFGAPDPSARTLRMPATFGLVVMGENLRNEQARRHGGPDAAREPGSYQLMLDAIGLLSHSTLGLDIDAIEIGAVRAVASFEALRERKVSMWAIELRTTITIAQISETPDGIADFKSFHADWDFAPFGQPVPVDAAPGTPGIQLPDDVHADAVDHIILER
jgi:phage gp37-like protein